MQYGVFDTIRRSDSLNPGDVRQLLCSIVVGTLAAQEKWPAGWAYDGGKSIFALTKFLPQHENEVEVKAFTASTCSLS
jgi:hypothetical protein